jgi:hypothetical protein
MCCSLIKSSENQASRFKHVQETWKKLAGGDTIGFRFVNFLCSELFGLAGNEITNLCFSSVIPSTSLNEIQLIGLYFCPNFSLMFADFAFLLFSNFCLAYLLQEKKSFQYGSDKTSPPRKWNDLHDLNKNLEFYFQCCSLSVTASKMAKIAATLANGGLHFKISLLLLFFSLFLMVVFFYSGVSPTTSKRIFTVKHVRNCLALMLSCGLYDFSGEWFALFVFTPCRFNLYLCEGPTKSDFLRNPVSAEESWS